MDEFNDVQQEQHFDFGEKKNTTRKTIKRTLLAIGLALAVYMVYSIVHLFLSPDRNIQQVYLVPEDAAFIIRSSAHSTIAGVLLAFVIPAKPQLRVGRYIERIRRIINTFPVMGENDIVLTNEQIAQLKRVESASDRVISPLQSLEDNLHGVVNYIILPLFAFVNAGVVFSGGGEVIGEVSIAVALGLLCGKFLGIYFFTWLAVKSKLTPMPQGMDWKNIAGVALLGGIGFTVSLFIANLSFGVTHPVLLNQAKFGVLSGTALAGILGYIVLYLVLPKKR